MSCRSCIHEKWKIEDILTICTLSLLFHFFHGLDRLLLRNNLVLLDCVLIIFFIAVTSSIHLFVAMCTISIIVKIFPVVIHWIAELIYFMLLHRHNLTINDCSFPTCRLFIYKSVSRDIVHILDLSCIRMRMHAFITAVAIASNPITFIPFTCR